VVAGVEIDRVEVGIRAVPGELLEIGHVGLRQGDLRVVRGFDDANLSIGQRHGALCLDVMDGAVGAVLLVFPLLFLIRHDQGIVPVPNVDVALGEDCIQIVGLEGCPRVCRRLLALRLHRFEAEEQWLAIAAPGQLVGRGDGPALGGVGT
jgi:hypothetical protein